MWEVSVVTTGGAGASAVFASCSPSVKYKPPKIAMVALNDLTRRRRPARGEGRRDDQQGASTAPALTCKSTKSNQLSGPGNVRAQRSDRKDISWDDCQEK